MRRERKLDVHSQLEDEEREASLPDALADRTKVVKLVVDKWFIDKGFGFGRVPTGEVIFIHVSVVRGAEVLTIGTDAWVQVMRDDARAQGGYRACKAWGHAAWKEERDKERASKVAEQVRRAAALTAELAGRSEKEVSEVCSHPPGLHDEPAQTGSVTSPVTISPFSLVASSSLAASDSSLPAGTVLSNHTGGFCGVQPPTVGSLPPSTQIGQKGAGRGARSSVARGQEVAAWVEETVGFYVKATGKDENQILQRLAEMKPEEVRRSREHWRLRAKEKQCFQEQEEEAWELFRRQPGHKQTTKEKFAQEFKRRVTNMVDGAVGSKAREKYLLEWTSELRKSAKGMECDKINDSAVSPRMTSHSQLRVLLCLSMSCSRGQPGQALEWLWHLCECWQFQHTLVQQMCVTVLRFCSVPSF